MTVISATITVGYVVGESRGQIESKGIGISKKAAKTDAYRKAMSRLKRQYEPARYRVIYTVPTEYRTLEGSDENED